MPFNVDLPKDDGALMSFWFYFGDETLNHSRRVYGIFDLFGDLGGVVEVILILGALSL